VYRQIITSTLNKARINLVIFLKTASQNNYTLWHKTQNAFTNSVFVNRGFQTRLSVVFKLCPIFLTAAFGFMHQRLLICVRLHTEYICFSSTKRSTLLGKGTRKNFLPSRLPLRWVILLYL